VKCSPVGEPDFTKDNMFLDQHLCLNIPIIQSNLRDKFTDYVKVRLTTVLLHQCYSPSFPFLFLGISYGYELGLGVGIGLGIYFQTGMLFQDQK